MEHFFVAEEGVDYAEHMHSVGDAMCVVDSNMNFLGFNKRFIELYGLPAEKLLGSNPFNIYPEFKKSVFYEAFEHTISTGKESNRLGFSNRLDKWILSRGFKHADNRYIAISQVLSNGFNKVGFVPNYDTLTSLKNRHCLENDISEFMANGVSFGLLIVDIKSFRYINELHGLEFGDFCLMEVAARIKGNSSKCSQVYRFSSDQFVVLVPNSKNHSLIDIENIHSAFKNKFVINSESHELKINIGFYFVENPLETVNEAVYKLELALSESKNSRALYSEYKEDTGSLKNKTKTANELKKAMRDGEFVLYYQAQIDSINKKICGVEALVRWVHPTRGILTPGAFLSIAEEFDLLEDLDKLVMLNAFRDQKYLIERNIRIPISINLSVQSLNDPNLITFVDAASNKYSIDKDGIIFELTEYSLVDSTIGKGVISALRDRDFKISIDDFGTGYSSFRYLIEYPSNFLKIDRSFIHNFNEYANLQSVVSNIIKMAHSLGILVVGEGIETMQEYELLKSFDCDFIQGFAFAKPEPKEDLIKRIEAKGLSTVKSSLS